MRAWPVDQIAGGLAGLRDATVDRLFFRFRGTDQLGQPHEGRHAEPDDHNSADDQGREQGDLPHRGPQRTYSAATASLKRGQGAANVIGEGRDGRSGFFSGEG